MATEGQSSRAAAGGFFLCSLPMTGPPCVALILFKLPPFSAPKMSAVDLVPPPTAVDAPPATPAKPKAPKVKKVPAAPKKPAAHPRYLEMISEAIMSLKERTGSSQYAISKFLEDKHKAHLPANFKKMLLVQLKKSAAAGKLTKVKNSYKIAAKPAALKKPTVTKPKVKSAAAKLKKAAALKPRPKSAAAKPKPKSAVVKTKAATTKPIAKPAAVKPKTVAKTKTVAPKPKAAGRPAKVAKTSVKAAPGSKPAAAAALKKAQAVKKAVVTKKAKK